MRLIAMKMMRVIRMRALMAGDKNRIRVLLIDAIHNWLNEGYKNEEANCHIHYHFKHPIVFIHHTYILTDQYWDLKLYFDDEDGR